MTDKITDNYKFSGLEKFLYGGSALAIGVSTVLGLMGHPDLARKGIYFSFGMNVCSVLAWGYQIYLAYREN